MQNYRLNRRTLIKNGALLGAAALMPSLALAQSRRIAGVGIQLYTLRNELARDFEGTLARVAELGYREIEFAGYYDHSAAEVRRVLDDNDLVSPAGHIPWAVVDADLQREIDFAAELGQNTIVIPYLTEEERTFDHYQRLVQTLNTAGEACRAAGLRIAYHNHEFEFETINGPSNDEIVPYDYILQQTDPELVDMELDLYWIAVAGVDAIPYFANHPGRFTLLHVKDMDEHGRMADVGKGTINFPEIFSHVEEAGFRHYFVEHDHPGDGIASIASSIYTLRNLRF